MSDLAIDKAFATELVEQRARAEARAHFTGDEIFATLPEPIQRLMIATFAVGLMRGWNLAKAGEMDAFMTTAIGEATR